MVDNKNGVSDDDHYGAFIDRFNLQIVHGPFEATGRVDAVGFIAAPTAEYHNDGRWERLTLRYTSDDWTLTGGDFFRQVGRGIILSIRKVDEAGLDLSIRGGQAEYRGNTHRFSLFGGVVNAANLDSVSQKFLSDPNDIVAGGHYEANFSDVMQAGLLGAIVSPRERVNESLADAGIITLDEGARDYTLSSGVYVDIPSDWLAFYGEADFQRRSVAGNDPEFGWASYASIDLNVLGMTFLVEGLALKDWEERGSQNSALKSRFDYNQPPTLERIDQEVFNQRNTLGGRIRIERAFDTLVLYANTMLRMNDFFESSIEATRQIHAYAGFEWDYDEGASRLYGSGGYRDEFRSSPNFEKSMWHVEADFLQHIVDKASFHLVTNHEFRELAGDKFGRGSTIVGADIAGSGGVAFEVGYDTTDARPGIRQFFLAAIINLEVSEALIIRAVGGTQRGGIKCVAGVCRDFPEFAGARAEIVLRL